MTLIFDIGNTNITAGMFRGGKPTFTFRIKTKPGAPVSYYSGAVSKILKTKSIKPATIKGSMVGSVVPSVTGTLVKAVKRATGKKPFLMSPKTELNIRNLYRKKSDVGHDRLANAAAGRVAFPGKNLIIIDFGTTITFDVVTKRGDYPGGIIMPGLNLSREILYTRTAKLPRVDMKYPAKKIGNTTVTAIQIGVISSVIAGINYIIAGIKKELRDKHAEVILTGGEVDNKILRMLDVNNAKIDHDFTLKGFKIIYDLNKGNG